MRFYRSNLTLAQALLSAVPSIDHTGGIGDYDSDMGSGVDVLASGMLRFFQKITHCSFVEIVFGDLAPAQIYLADKCTGQVEPVLGPPVPLGQSEAAGHGNLAHLSLATTGGAAASRGRGPAIVTNVTLAGGSQMVAWVVSTGIKTGIFTGSSNTPQVTGQYTSGPTPEHVIAADFNGDGNMDLAVSNFGNLSNNTGGNIAIFFGNGAGSFTAGPTVNSGATPVALFAADFNGDNKMDLAVANVDPADTISILLGNGDGTFQPPMPYSVPISPASVIAVDFNHDNHLDLAVANGYGGGVSILLGNGNGTFQPAQQYPAGNGQSTYLEWIDLNGDNNPDLIVSNPQSYGISLLLGKGDGSFQAPAEYATCAGSQSFGLVNDNAGKLWIATADAVSGDVCYMRLLPSGVADGPPIYMPPRTPSGPANATGVATGDLNGDGFPDIVAAAQGAISVLLLVPGATFSPAVNYTLQSSSQPVEVAVADIDGDGKNDVVAASLFTGNSGNFGGTLDVALNNGNGTLGTQSSYALGGYPGGFEGAVPSGLVTGDFNGDHKPDVAVGYQPDPSGGGSGGISVFINQAGGTLLPAVSYPVGGLAVSGLVTGDFNGDTKLDLAATGVAAFGASAPGDLAILTGNGDGTFQTAVLIPIGSPAGTPTALAAGDLNHDNKLDLVVSIHDASFNYSIVVLLGNGNGTFNQLPPIASPAQGESLALVDLNGDGTLDLVVGDCCGLESVYLLGDGDGTFQSPIYFSSGSQITGMAVTSFGVAGLALSQKNGTVEALKSALNPMLFSSRPTLIISNTHYGNFTPGQQGAIYTIAVSNLGGAAPVSGTVTVTDTVPSGLTLVSMAGDGWTCPSGGSTCTRNDALAGGNNYQPITVTVNVSASATSPQLNVASASGGGSAAVPTVTDSTLIGSCTYTLTPPPTMPAVPSSAGSGTVTVITQTGCPWTASSDSPWLTVTSGSAGSGTGTVNYMVAANSTSTSRTGTLTIAFQVFPVTQLPPPVLTVSDFHFGNFVAGTFVTYTINVFNTAGTSPTSGVVTVTDTFGTGLILPTLSGSGWSCINNTCTRSDTLPPGTNYPTIFAGAQIATNAPPQVTNQVTVSGGGSATATASDTAGVLAATCSFTLGSTSASLTQTGTASPGGVQPEAPVTVAITPTAGATCGSYTANSSGHVAHRRGRREQLYLHRADQPASPSSRTATSHRD